MLGLQLLFNGLRIFEPYRFNLFIQFLLAEGFVGDFFFLLDDGSWYMAATATHLLLLMGFLSKESERLPNQVRNRFGRLGGASLWALVPLVAYLGTPLLADGLRLIFRSFADLWPHLVVLAVLSALVFEQAILSSDLLRRPIWMERVLSLGLSVAVLALPIQALLLVSDAHRVAGDEDRAALALFLILPFVWTLILHCLHSRIHETLFSSRRIVTPPGNRMQASVDGKTVSVLFLPPAPQKYIFIRGAGKALVIVGVGLAAASIAGRANKADAMVLALISGFAGSAMAGLMLQWFQRRVLFQVREGYARTAKTIFGGVGRHLAPWQRRPLLPTQVRKLLGQQRASGDNTPQVLNRAQLRWINDVLAGGNGRGRANHTVRPDTFRLSVRRPADMPENVDFLPVEIECENRTHASITVGAVENLHKGSWRATIDGQAADLFLNRTEREKLFAPGRVTVCQGKIFPYKIMSAAEDVLVEVSCGEIRAEPFWYPLGVGEQRASA